ncbi:MAG: alpha/beta fold hydrolase [Candidatus Magnetoovum sp. WYHC-5]|nr:alpha/beta fold hydrolase [Candidatus Magnetoovum sp. WYHC-5]
MGNVKQIIAISVVVLLLLSISVCAAHMRETGANIKKSDISFKTQDGVTIHGTYGRPAHGIKTRLSAVLLIHQYDSNRSEWDAFFNYLVQEGFAVLSYDVRGHGHSDKVEDMEALLTAPDKAPQDLYAAIRWLKGREEVSPQRIAVIGASMGGNLACLVSGLQDKPIKTAVVISAKTSSVKSLSVKAENFKMSSVFYIAGAKDEERALYARELADMTAAPVDIKIYENSSAHGVQLINENPDLNGLILSWLKKTL